jgi:hypothetical protein
MSRRANILLLLALAAGIGYGYFGVPFLLPFVAEQVEDVAEEPVVGVISEAHNMQCRMLSLRPGMKGADVHRVLGLANTPFILGRSDAFGAEVLYRVGESYILQLSYDRNMVLMSVKLYYTASTNVWEAGGSTDQVSDPWYLVASAPLTPGK